MSLVKLSSKLVGLQLFYLLQLILTHLPNGQLPSIISGIRTAFNGCSNRFPIWYSFAIFFGISTLIFGRLGYLANDILIFAIIMWSVLTGLYWYCTTILGFNYFRIVVGVGGRH